jgi:DNA/RNA-binding domain of Phe-tRNA-synthetase-like protein
MTEFVVADDVCAAYKDLRIDAIVAEGFNSHQPWPEVADQLATLEAGPAPTSGEDDPHISSWHAAYRAFGTNPRRERPSVDALRRRLARSGRLPRINPAVDCYNMVSARYGIPAGAFDLRAVTGDITIRFANGSEAFTPLGEPGKTEHPRPGEVIYTDDGGVLTRHWNHRDADRTKVTSDSASILFLLETVEADAFGARLDQASGALISLLRTRSAQVSCCTLTAASPRATLAQAS